MKILEIKPRINHKLVLSKAANKVFSATLQVIHNRITMETNKK